MAAADVVIVGSGPAGCGAAARLLAEGRRVTMLEAGPGPERPAAVTSLDALAAAATPGWTWPGVHWRRAGADRGPYAIGRGVGGGSAVNAMVLTVGDPAMHDAWAARTGDDGWAWAAFDDAYQRILAQLPATTLEAGPLGQAVALAAERTAGSGVTPGGARGTGGGRPSTLAVGATGVLAATVAADAGQRLPLVDVVCAADGGGRHPHLDVQCNRQVRRVMAGVDGAVVGVETDDGDRVTAPAVVLAAGALHSPALAETGRPPRWVGPVAGEGPRPVMDHPSFAFTVALRPEARVDPSPLPPVSIVVRCGPQGGLDGPTSVLVHVLDHVGPGEEGRRHGAVVVALAEPSSVGTVEPGPDGAMLIEPAWLDDGTVATALLPGAHVIEHVHQDRGRAVE
ncbi:MAG: GMC family oxidoreductase N-terminal domain-containing protein, partial [Actinomycetota bacterium]